MVLAATVVQHTEFNIQRSLT